MKMRRLYWFLLVIIACTAIPKASQALQVGIGASTWYSAWDFESDNSDNDPDFDSTLLYGPVLTIGFSPEWSLSGVFLYGTFKNSKDGGPSEISRFDSDITINYSLNSYIKLFLGFKYMGYKFSEGDTDGEHAGYGPGFGITLIVPLAENLYFLGSLSGLYITGHHENPGSGYDYNEPGYNASASLAYSFTGASTVISLGGRYQYFRTRPESSSNESDLYHTFYGVTLTAIYSFGI